jgi:four helix bundle protein
MATFSRFEDLNVWQAARVLSQDIFLITKSDAFSKDYDLKRQILRSSGSGMDNIAEGFERKDNNEFIQFLSISKASCGETRSQLYRALNFNSLKEQCESLSKELSGFINYLKKSDHRGKKFNRA